MRCAKVRFLTARRDKGAYWNSRRIACVLGPWINSRGSGPGDKFPGRWQPWRAGAPTKAHLYFKARFRRFNLISRAALPGAESIIVRRIERAFLHRRRRGNGAIDPGASLIQWGKDKSHVRRKKLRPDAPGTRLRDADGVSHYRRLCRRSQSLWLTLLQNLLYHIFLFLAKLL